MGTKGLLLREWARLEQKSRCCGGVSARGNARGLTARPHRTENSARRRKSMQVEIGGAPRGPLAGVRVLDFTTVVSGPLCTQVLGDLGADVVKVEAPRGDSARRMGPPFRGGLGPVWVQFNRNKRAVVIDLQQAAGVAVARRIAATADAVIENFRPGVADRLGVGYAALSAEHPRLVYAAISGFGPDGPYAEQPAYDTVIQGLSGFMHTQGTPDAPALVRGRTGRGQRIDVAMLDAYAAFALPDVLGPESFHPVEEQPAGMLTANNIHRTWPTADGHVVMMIVEDGQFSAICRALDRTDLEQDPRFGGLLDRLANGVALYGLLEVEVAKWSTAELVERARRYGAPLAP